MQGVKDEHKRPKNAPNAARVCFLACPHQTGAHDPRGLVDPFAAFLPVTRGALVARSANPRQKKKPESFGLFPCLADCVTAFSHALDRFSVRAHPIACLLESVGAP